MSIVLHDPPSRICHLVEGCWATLAMLDPRRALANREDLKIPRCLDTADEAIVAVRDFHAKWKARQNSDIP
jgi:hypothetical protein